MPYREIVHPKMSRAAFDLLSDDERSTTQNPDGTFTIFRYSRQRSTPMPLNVEIIDEPLLSPGRVELSPSLQVRLTRSDRPTVDLATSLVRHCGGDWGEVTDALGLANDIAVLDGSRPIASLYRLSDGTLTITTRPNQTRTRLAWSDADSPDPAGDPEAYARTRSVFELVDAVERAGDECEEPRRSLLLEAARRLLPFELDAPFLGMPEPPIEVDLTDADWRRVGAEDQPGGTDARILTTMLINETSFHVLGIGLFADDHGTQFAYQGDDFERIHAALGDDGPWQTVTWEGREYGLIVTPYSR